MFSEQVLSTTQPNSYVCGQLYKIFVRMLTSLSKFTIAVSNTVVPRYFWASELIKPGTHLVLTRKTVLALRALSTLVTLARTYVSHNSTPQEEMLH